MLRVCQQVASRGQYLDRTLLLLVTWASDLPLHTITVNAVLLSLQNVEASCHKHFVVISCEQQTKPFTSDECHQLATTACDEDILAENRHFCLAHLHSMPSSGVPIGILP